MSDCSCHHSKSNKFNAEEAFLHLYEKYERLAETLADYMAQAGLERALRVKNALLLSDKTMAVVGGSDTTDFSECCFAGIRDDYFCSGVLIHRRMVLTAAHCCFARDTAIDRLRVGGTNRFNGVRLDVVKSIPHPNYDRATGSNDIAVLILASDAPFAPAAIAKTAEFDAADEVTAVGFGHSNFIATSGLGLKRQVTVPLDRHADLSEAEARLGFDHTLEFTAGGNGRDTCEGDSGGPAYIQVGTKHKIAGLTSRPHNQSTRKCGDGGIYTRTDVHLDFIRRTAQENHITDF